jgi:anti-sigma factor RsiW
MNRRHIQHLFSGHIDGSLSPAATRFVEAHLSSCPDCARELQQWRAVLRLVSYHAPMSCPIDCAEVVLRTIEARRAARMVGDRTECGSRGRRAFGAPRFATLSAPVVSALVLSIVLLGGGAWLRMAEVSQRPAALRPWALARMTGHRSPDHSSPMTAGVRLATNVPMTATDVPVRAHAPDRLQEAFGRSDSLILAADFVEDDR